MKLVEIDDLVLAKFDCNTCLLAKPLSSNLTPPLEEVWAVVHTSYLILQG